MNPISVSPEYSTWDLVAEEAVTPSRKWPPFGRHGEYFRVKCQFGGPVLVARAKHRRGTQQSYYYSVVHVLCQLILLFKRFKHFLARFSEKADPKVIAIYSKDDSVNYLTGLVRILLSEHCQQCVIIDSVTHRLKPD